MKIKRFKNLWTMGLILSASILGLVYLLKIFFPEFVIEVAHTESIVTIGRYIDTHKWAWYLVSLAISFATCYLTCCASCKKKCLTNTETIILIATIVLIYLAREFTPSIYTTLNYCSMITLPLIFKGDFKATVICFCSVNFLQAITLEVRNINTMIADFNVATGLILLIDVYILQVLLYFLFNFKEGDI